MTERDVDLDLLATFLEIYRHGSLTLAAAGRGVSQPAVSGQLGRLEQRLGAILFVRSPRGVTATDRAHDLARRIGPHLDGLRQAVAVTDAPPEPLGVIRVGGAADVMAIRILPALAPLTRAGLKVHATLGLAGDLLAALTRKELDLVVSSIRPTARNLVATPLIDEEFALVGPPVLARTVDVRQLAEDPVRALAHLPLVAYDEGLPIIRRYWRSEFGRRPTNDVAMIVADLRAVLAAVIAGAGVSVLPRYIAEPAVAAGSVEELHRPGIQPLNTLFLATLVGGMRDPSVSLAHERLTERAHSWGSL